MNSNNKYRNIYCGNISTNDVGKKVKIAVDKVLIE